MNSPVFDRTPIRVLRLIPVLDFGGVESQFVTLAESWRSPEIQLEFCTFWRDGDAAEKIRALGYTVHVLDQSPSIRNPSATSALLKFLRQHKPDIVHSTIGEANFHNMLCAPFGRWRTIIEEAGIPQRKLRNRLIHAALYRTCDKIVAVSQASADYLLQNEWAPRDRVVVLPNSVQQRFYDNVRANYVPGSPRIFRAVGRLTAVKNYAMLIRAFAQARQQAPDIRLEIVGEGEDRQQLESLIHELNASSFIMLRGFISDIVALHKDTDFFLMPSLSEGFGLAAAEAMAMGVPGLASRVGGLSTVFGALANECLVSPDSEQIWSTSIVKLSRISAENYENLVSQVVRQASNFNPRSYAKNLSEWYSK